MGIQNNVKVDTQEYSFGKMFDGSDVTVDCELKIGGEIKRFQLATIQALHVVTQTEIVPRFEIGKGHPIAVTKGKRAISGTCVFAVISFSTIEIIKEQIGKTIDGTSNGKELQYLDELPPLKFVITANNGINVAKKEITGVNLFDTSSAVGLSQLGSVQQCKFIATDITQLEKVIIPAN